MDEIRHKDGVAWLDAPLPPEDHDCWVQTSGWTGPEGLHQVLRCACGAIADGIDIKAAREVGMSPRRQNRLWLERNSRRGITASRGQMGEGDGPSPTGNVRAGPRHPAGAGHPRAPQQHHQPAGLLMALTEQIVVRLSPEDLHHLEYLALQARVTRSEMVRRLIAPPPPPGTPGNPLVAGARITSVSTPGSYWRAN